MSLEYNNIKRGWILVAADGSVTASDGGCFSAVSRTGAGVYVITLSPAQDANYSHVRALIRGGAATANVKTAWTVADTQITVSTFVGAVGGATDEIFELLLTSPRAN